MLRKEGRVRLVEVCCMRSGRSTVHALDPQPYEFLAYEVPHDLGRMQNSLKLCLPTTSTSCICSQKRESKTCCERKRTRLSGVYTVSISQPW